MTGINLLIDTLLHQVLGKRVDTPPPEPATVLAATIQTGRCRAKQIAMEDASLQALTYRRLFLGVELMSRRWGGLLSNTAGERVGVLLPNVNATPVVLLTKPDVCDDVAARVAEVVTAAGEVPVHVVSPKLNRGIGQVAEYLLPGRTGALLGSSGVGKSTIINRLVGQDVRKTREVREADSKGRHTTSHRELVVLPNGGLIIDTPGMRELQLWDVGDAVRETFEDIEALAADCHFTDCRHRDEPRCAVKAAVAEGRLPAARLESYLKLQDELAFLARQQDERAQIEEKRRGRIGAKALRQHLKSKRL